MDSEKLQVNRGGNSRGSIHVGQIFYDQQRLPLDPIKIQELVISMGEAINYGRLLGGNGTRVYFVRLGPNETLLRMANEVKQEKGHTFWTRPLSPEVTRKNGETSGNSVNVP